MSKITAQDVQHMARQSRLAVKQEEAAAWADRLQALSRFHKQLAACQVAEVAPSFYVHEGYHEMRPDCEQPSLPQEAVLRQAPARQEDYFRVPRVLED